MKENQLKIAQKIIAEKMNQAGILDVKELGRVADIKKEIVKELIVKTTQKAREIC